MPHNIELSKDAKKLALEAAALIKSKGWCQKAYAKDAAGNEAYRHCKEACAFCISGAIDVARYKKGISALDQEDLCKVLCDEVGTSIITWNDYSKRTKKQVIDLLEKVGGKK